MITIIVVVVVIVVVAAVVVVAVVVSPFKISNKCATASYCGPRGSSSR